MIIKIVGVYDTKTKEIDTEYGLKIGGLFIPNEDKIVSLNCIDDHLIELKVSKKGNLVAILRK